MVRIADPSPLAALLVGFIRGDVARGAPRRPPPGPREASLPARFIAPLRRRRSAPRAARRQASRSDNNATLRPRMTDLLVWMDLEMTGLDAERERVIELAVVITTGELDVVAEGPDLVIHQPDDILAAMDDWNTKHHGASGLTARVRASEVTEAIAEAQVVAFIDQHVPAKEKPPLCGNSIHQDRRFIRRYLPALDARLHYRMLDVSTVKELGRRWYPQIHDRRPIKNETHRALDDIRESIAELRFYRDHIFAPRPPRASAGC
jgi:oligoribonuclease